MAKGAYIGVETPQASTGSLPVGSSVFLNVGGVRTEFLVVHQGLPSSLYDVSCTGTWLMMKDIYEKRVWDSSDHQYEISDIHAYLNSTFLGSFDGAIQSAIKQVKIPYTKGLGTGGSVQYTENGLSAKIFLPSGYEVGLTTNDYSYLGIEGKCLKYFEGADKSKRVGFYNGTAIEYWTRTPNPTNTGLAIQVHSSGNYYNGDVKTSHGIRPVMILPSNLGVGNDGFVTGEEPVSKGIARKIEKGYVGIEQKTIQINSLEVGSSVFLSVNGTAKEFLVIQQGHPDTSTYDSSCNGTWLLMKDIYENRAWDAGNNDYGNSDIHAYLNGDFLGLFDANIQSAIKEVKIPYQNGTGSGGSLANGSNGLTAKIFLLSMYEVGLTGASWDPGIGVCLSYFEGTSTANYDSKRVAYLNGTASAWWLRSPNINGLGDVRRIDSSGNYANSTYSSTIGVRPALILDSSLLVSEGGIVTSKQTASIGIARKIKKAYIGIGNVARPCFGMGKLAYYGAITKMAKGESSMAHANVGKYVLFGYGSKATMTSGYINAYDRSLTYSNPASTGTRRQVGAASIGKHALFAGGWEPGPDYHNMVHAYNESLTQTRPPDLPYYVDGISGAANRKYAIFASGTRYYSSSGSSAGINTYIFAYNESLTVQTLSQSYPRRNSFGVSFGEYAIFGGGYSYNSSGDSTIYSKTLYVFDDSLTITTINLTTELKGHRDTNTATEKYAIFAGINGKTTEAINKDLTVLTAPDLDIVTPINSGGATALGDYALIFTTYYNGNYYYYKNFYDSSLSKVTTVTGSPSFKPYFSCGSVGKFAIICGGVYSDTDTYYTDAYAYTLI